MVNNGYFQTVLTQKIFREISSKSAITRVLRNQNGDLRVACGLKAGESQRPVLSSEGVLKVPSVTIHVVSLLSFKLLSKLFIFQSQLDDHNTKKTLISLQLKSLSIQKNINFIDLKV